MEAGIGPHMLTEAPSLHFALDAGYDYDVVMAALCEAGRDKNRMWEIIWDTVSPTGLRNCSTDLAHL